MIPKSWSRDGVVKSYTKADEGVRWIYHHFFNTWGGRYNFDLAEDFAAYNPDDLYDVAQFLQKIFNSAKLKNNLLAVTYCLYIAQIWVKNRLASEESGDLLDKKIKQCQNS